MFSTNRGTDLPGSCRPDNVHFMSTELLPFVPARPGKAELDELPGKGPDIDSRLPSFRGLQVGHIGKYLRGCPPASYQSITRPIPNGSAAIINTSVTVDLTTRRFITAQTVVPADLMFI